MDRPIQGWEGNVRKEGNVAMWGEEGRGGRGEGGGARGKKCMPNTFALGRFEDALFPEVPRHGNFVGRRLEASVCAGNRHCPRRCVEVCGDAHLLVEVDDAGPPPRPPIGGAARPPIVTCSVSAQGRGVSSGDWAGREGSPWNELRRSAGESKGGGMGGSGDRKDHAK